MNRRTWCQSQITKIVHIKFCYGVRDVNVLKNPFGRLYFPLNGPIDRFRLCRLLHLEWYVYFEHIVQFQV